MAILIKDLNFSYGNKKILKNINLHIKKGKLTGILGPNGCGKSTLLKNILGALKSESGDILFDSISQKEFSRNDLAKIISLVPQKSNLSSPLSVDDFVLMGRLPHLKSSWSGYSKSDITIKNSVLENLKLSHFKDRITLNLSGGEFQRVLLARSLTQKPKILLLDEPTSALDINHAIELLIEVKKLIKNGITGVIVLHDLNLASLFCDELVIMKNGNIVSQGTPNEVLNESTLLEIYNLHSKIIRDQNEKLYIVPIVPEEI